MNNFKFQPIELTPEAIQEEMAFMDTLRSVIYSMKMEDVSETTFNLPFCGVVVEMKIKQESENKSWC